MTNGTYKARQGQYLMMLIRIVDDYIVALGNDMALKSLVDAGIPNGFVMNALPNPLTVAEYNSLAGEELAILKRLDGVGGN